jgi:CBS domain-containing protein
MRISSIFVRNVRTADAKDTVKKAALVMNKYRIGCVVVMDGKRPAGIITERDILRRIVAAGKNAADVKCREIMSKPLLTIEVGDEIEDAIELMVKKKVKKLVVTRSGHFAGIVTTTDILRSGEKIEYAVLKKLAEFFPLYEGGGEAG